MTRNRIYIAPVGGLGNQLFEYVAGLSLCLSNDKELHVDLTLGNLRNSLEEHSPIERIQHLSNVKLFRGRGIKRLNRKIHLYLLRVSTNANRFEATQLNRFFVSLVASCYFSIIYSDLVRVTLSNGVGYAPIANGKLSQLVVGYFQSYKYLEELEVFKEFKVLPVRPSDLLKKLLEQASGEKVLILHVRLGDYLKEELLGNLNIDYYDEALKFHFSKVSYTRIWVFSEDVDSAKKFIPIKYLDKCKWIDDVEGDEIYSLIAMQRGDGYIIANSSFSWWGARLSLNKSAVVVAPKPWFSRIESPIDLIPSNWHELDV